MDTQTEKIIEQYKKATRDLLDIIEEKFGYGSEEMNQALISFGQTIRLTWQLEKITK